MLKKSISLILLGQALLFSAAFGQTDEAAKKNYLGVGPVIGFDQARKSAIYGGVLEYEYKPFKRFGFTIASTYDFNPNRTYRMMVPDFDSQEVVDGPEFQLKQRYLSLTGGFRFYMKRFFIGAAAGYGHNWGEFFVPSTNERFPGSAERFYNQIAGGYLFPLTGGRQLEVGLFSSSGGSPKALGLPKVAAAAKYRFGF